MLPVPTPQFEWEPPRLYPESRTINARWRLGLMGFPLHWLDVEEGVARGLAGARCRDVGRWMNRKGVEATGNAQVPQNVELIARAMLEAERLTGGAA